MRVKTVLIAAAALAVGALLGRLTVPISAFASVQQAESAAPQLGGGAATPIALEVPVIVGAGTYNTCGVWDDPVILRP